MERRNFLKFLAASPLVPATVKARIESGEEEPKFTKCILVDYGSDTYPHKAGDKVWAYFVPNKWCAILKDGRYISKDKLRIIK